MSILRRAGSESFTGPLRTQRKEFAYPYKNPFEIPRKDPGSYENKIKVLFINDDMDSKRSVNDPCFLKNVNNMSDLKTHEDQIIKMIRR
jgi:hypothetical protein